MATKTARSVKRRMDASIAAASAAVGPDAAGAARAITKEAAHGH